MSSTKTKTLTLDFGDIRPESLQSQIEYGRYSNLIQSPDFIVLLCEEWELTLQETFEEFWLEWDRKYLFSSYTNLEYQLRRYREVYSTSKAVRKAAYNGRDDFVWIIVNKHHNNKSLKLNILLGYLDNTKMFKKYSRNFSLYDSRLFITAMRRGIQNTYLKSSSYLECIRDIYNKKSVDKSIPVSILAIARIMKDHTVLANPYFLNRPNIIKEFKRDNIASSNSHYLWRKEKITPDELEEASYKQRELKETICYFFDSIDYFSVHLYPVDVYSCKWIEKKLKEREMSICYTRVGRNKKAHILGSIIVIISSKSGEVLSLKEQRLDEMCPDVSEWFDKHTIDDDTLFLSVSD